MADEPKAKRQWSYRPTDEEHELLLRAMQRAPEYVSIAQFVREGVLRLIYDSDRRPLFSQLAQAIDELHETKKDFMNLLLRQSEGPNEGI